MCEVHGVATAILAIPAIFGLFLVNEAPERLHWMGRSYRDLCEFPDDAKDEPDDWKPMLTIGHGVQEIRIHEDSGAFRVIYVAKFEEAIYVLHSFQKKTQKTAQHDIELARERFKAMIKERTL